MPFRSQSEPLREQIRRVEEQAHDLLGERAALEQQLSEREGAGRSVRRRLLVVACMGVAAIGFVGFTAGDLAAGKRARHDRVLLEQRQVAEVDRVWQTSHDCSALEGTRQSALASCEEERATAQWQTTLPSMPRPSRPTAPVPPAGLLR